ncbi:MAG: hypothetical protein H5T74_12585 [Actinobacteria bacterium]|nr:hypothetical protein [Actinomycetota bacterium]MDI6832038.1 hypothetical protein [Actinomycetota bacterium]
MLKSGKAETGGGGMAGKLMPVFLVLALGLLAVRFARLDESRRRFIVHLLKQVPYLPGRYYA